MGNYVGCLIIVVIFMGLGGAEGMGEDFKVIGLGEGQATKVWDHFLWGN